MRAFNWLFGWIRCKSLPKENRIYVVLDSKTKHVGLAYVKNNVWKDMITHMDYEFKCGDYQLQVTHYFPLPKFPKI